MNVYLIDGTYELFRHFHALPSSTDSEGREMGAVRGVVASVLGMLEEGVTHLGVATDHVIESFRNDLHSGYKTGDGIDPALSSQFELLETSLTAMGVVVWPMVEYEADDALGAAAIAAGRDPSVEKVYICTPDKDLAQSVEGTRIIQLDRKAGDVRDEAAIRKRFGVPPRSIPDFLGLVGDTADGIPGLKGWGAKSAAAVLAHYLRLEEIPWEASEWEVRVRGADTLARTLKERWADALLFRDLATLRTDIPVFDAVEDLRWHGPCPEFADLCRSFRAERLWETARRLTPPVG